MSNVDMPITLFDILSAVWRYRGRFLATTFAVLALAVVAIFLWPKRYESEAQLFVRLGRGNASMDPATVGQTISIQESREGEMVSVVHLLESRSLAEKVVDEVGTERIMKKYALVEQGLDALADCIPSFGGGAPSDDGGPALTAEDIKAGKRRDVAIKELQKNLKVNLTKKSTTVAVAYRARTPNLAQEIVQKTVDVFQEMHMKAYQSDGSLSFFEQQFAQQQRIVNECEDALRVAKNEHGIVTLEARQESLKEEYTQTKKLQLEAKAEYEAALERVSALQSSLADVPVTLDTEKTQGFIATNAREAMRDRLFALELQEKDLAAKYSESHPELRKVRTQLASARTILEEQSDAKEQSKEAVNPVWIEIENALIKAKGELKATEAKVEALVTLEAELLERQQALNDLEIESQELQRRIDVAKENYRIYARKLEESRINDALDRDALTNVSLVAEPTLRFKHASPKRSILAILALLVAGVCGLAVALASDYFPKANRAAELRDAEFTIYRSNVESTLQSRSVPSTPEPVPTSASVSESDVTTVG